MYLLIHIYVVFDKSEKEIKREKSTKKKFEIVLFTRSVCNCA